MPTDNGSRELMSPLLLVNLVMYLAVLGLAVDGETHHHLGGNLSTGYLLIFSLLAGTVGTCSSLAGLLHLRAWREYSFASAFTSALVLWALTTISFGYLSADMQADQSGKPREPSEDSGSIHHNLDVYSVDVLGPSLASIGQGNRDHGADYRMPARETQKDRTTTSPPDAV